VLAPNAKLRALMVPLRPEVQEQTSDSAVAGGESEVETVHARPRRISWARLVKRAFDIDMQHWPKCGAGEIKITAAIVERPVWIRSRHARARARAAGELTRALAQGFAVAAALA
jgi:hypothetical protein